MENTKKEKKSWLKGFLFEETDEVQTKTESPSSNNQTNINGYSANFTNAQPPQFVHSAGTGQGVLIPEIKQDLENIIKQNNFPGEDYFEFKEAVKNMTGVGLDVNSAMKAALATLQTRGLTKEKAVSTANEYISILNKEKETFLSTVESQREQKINKPESEIISLNEENKNLAKQIEEITAKISSNNESASKKKGEIAEASAKIETIRLNYEFTHSVVVREIQDDIQKIQTI